MSLYKEYIEEKTDKQVLEYDDGFALYSFYDKDTVFIEDVYVKPEHRKCGVARQLVDAVAAIAKERGCTKIVTTVRPSLKHNMLGLCAAIAYGFQLDSAANDLVLFKKDLV